MAIRPPEAGQAAASQAAASQAATSQGPAPAPSRPAARWRLRSPETTPTRLQLLLVALLLASLAWGAVTTWTVLAHASAAGSVVSASEPLSLDAQRMYRSLSDADITATTAFLGGPDEPLAARQRFAADIRQAGADLSDLKGSADPRLRASLAAVSTGLPVYAGYVAQAQDESALGYPLTGGSFMQVASEEMHVVLLPAARTVYQRENAALHVQSAAATGLPWIAVALALAIAIGVIMIRVQRWLSRRTNRIANPGLFAATAALGIATVWLLVAFGVARSDSDHGAGQGSVPAEQLAQADIDTQQIRGDEILNLISRSGNTSFQQDYRDVRGHLGPGAGTLLTQAAQAAPGGAGAHWAAAAAADAAAFYASNDQVYRLDSAASYADEARLVAGTGAGSSSVSFSRMEADLARGIAADQVVFRSSAAAGADAFTGLGAGIVIAALIMAVGSAWGLSRRLAEYR